MTAGHQENVIKISIAQMWTVAQLSSQSTEISQRVGFLAESGFFPFLRGLIPLQSSAYQNI